MIALDIEAPSYGTNFVRWASRLTETLADQHVAPPTSEDAWQQWAAQLVGINDLDNLVPYPQGFTDWRAWAQRLCQNLN